MHNAAQARGGALCNPEFRKFWIGETVSLVGTEVTRIALPLVAILSLGASAFEVGLVNAARYVPIVAFSLFAGIWLERRRRRPILIATNAGRAVLIGLIPAASVMHVLSVALLLAVALIVGTLTVIFDVGSLTYIPGLVDRRVLADANGRLQTSFSLALIVGPSLGGYLVGALDAPRALTADAASFAFSALMLGLIRVREAAPEVPEVRTPWRSQIAEGLHAVYGSPILRSLLTQSATFNLATNAMLTVFVVYAIRTVGLSASQLGLVLGVGAFGALAGSMIANRVTRLIGLGRALRLTTICACGAPLLFLAARGHGALSMTILVAAYAVYSLNLVIFNVNTVTLRQVVTPPQVLARMNASYRMVLFGTVPIGALLGGMLGQYAGLRLAMIITVLLLTAPLAWTPFSPVFLLRTMPTGPLAGRAADGPAGEPQDFTPAGEPEGATA
jgi:MFS family permease